MHPYTNMPDLGFEVVADTYIEAYAARFRVLAGRGLCDLYDVVNLYRNIEVRKEPSGVG